MVCFPYVRYVLRSLCLLVVTADVPSSPIPATLMMEALSSSEMSVLTRATLRNIPKVAILHSHRRENLKSYTIISVFLTTLMTIHCYI
jgi:hypothetical protein